LYGIHAGFQTAECCDPTVIVDVEAVPVARHLALHHHGDEQLGLIAEFYAIEAARGDSDHCKRVSIDREGLAENGTVGSKSGLPEIIAEHRHRVTPGNTIVVRRERAP